MRQTTVYWIAVLIVIIAVSLFAQEVEPQKTIPKGTLETIPATISEIANLLKVQERYTIFSEDFEQGGTNWQIDTTVWQIGVPQSGPGNAFQGQKVAATNLTGNYDNNWDGRLISPQITLPILSGEKEHIYLEFHHWFQVESQYDFCFVEISTDGQNWQRLIEYNGETTTWKYEQISLDNYAGQVIQLAFRFTSDGSRTYAGWYVDAIQIVHYKPSPVDIQILALDYSLFPWIYITARVDSFGYPTASISPGQFQVTENGVLQTDGFQVTTPGQGNNQRLVDIVFLMDNSGSMGDEQDAVRQNVHDFVSQLVASGANYALGLIRFGSSENGGYPILENNGQLTQDTTYFLDGLWTKNTTSGGFEPGWDAIVSAATQINFRPGALRVVILITDETPTDDGNVGQYSYHQALQTALQNQLLVFAMVELSDPHAYEDYATIAEQTGGAYYNVTDPMDGILQAIGSAVTGNYIISYRSSDPVPAGEREVVVTVNAFNAIGRDTTYYTPGTNIIISLTDSTKKILSTQQPRGNPIPISVNVTDPAPPYVHSVRLFYKHKRSNYFYAVAMNQDAYNDSIWWGHIPASVIDTPSVQFYIEAQDSNSSVTLPASLPQKQPFEIAIYPNYVPFIFHYPPRQSMTSDVPILAMVYDVTNRVDSCHIYFREDGELLWTRAPMPLVARESIDNYAQRVANQFSISAQTIKDSILAKAQRYGHNLNSNTMVSVYQFTLQQPVRNVTKLWYYIEATDDYGTVGRDGYQNEPYAVEFVMDILKYAPIFYLHPDEMYFPISIETFFRHSRLIKVDGCFPFEERKVITENIQFSDLKQWRFIELKQFYTRHDTIGIPPDPVLYYHVDTNRVKNRRVVQFWLFFPYNSSLVNVHEGDWEHVDIIYEPMDAEVPSKLITSFHDYYFVYNWDELTFEDEHPVIYVEKGSHALYASMNDCSRVLYTQAANKLVEYNCGQVFYMTNLINLVENILTGGAGVVDDPVVIVAAFVLRYGCEMAFKMLMQIVYDTSIDIQEKAQMLSEMAGFCQVSMEGKKLGPLGTTSDLVYQLRSISPAWGQADVFWGAKWSRPTAEYRLFAFPVDYFSDIYGGMIFGLDGDWVTFYQSGPFSPIHKKHRPEPGEYAIIEGRLAEKPKEPSVLFQFAEDLIADVEILTSEGNTAKVFRDNAIVKACQDSALQKVQVKAIRYGGQAWVTVQATETTSGRVILRPSGQTEQWRLLIQNYTYTRDAKTYRLSGSFKGDSVVVIPFTLVVNSDKTTDLLITQTTKTPLTSQNVYAYPNPLDLRQHQGVTIRYSIAKDAEVTVTIMDIAGRPIKTVVDGVPKAAGLQHAVVWDGTDNQGNRVANGVYFYRIQTSAGEQATGKILVIQ